MDGNSSNDDDADDVRNQPWVKARNERDAAAASQPSGVGDMKRELSDAVADDATQGGEAPVSTPASRPAKGKGKGKAKGKAPAAPKGKKPASKPGKGKAAPKAGKPAKASKAKAASKPKGEKVPLDRFGFREGSVKSKAAAMYADGKGATLAEVKEALGSVQLNLLKELEGKGFTVTKKREAQEGQRPSTRYKLSGKASK